MSCFVPISLGNQDPSRISSPNPYPSLFILRMAPQDGIPVTHAIVHGARTMSRESGLQETPGSCRHRDKKPKARGVRGPWSEQQQRGWDPYSSHCLDGLVSAASGGSNNPRL